MKNSGSPAEAPRAGSLSAALSRFYESSISSFYNHHFYRLRKFVQEVADSMRANETVLDVGAGECPYKSYFAGRCRYLSQDVGGKEEGFTYDQIDIRSDVYQIPLSDASVDVILCTQVLEHLKYPDKAIREMFRLLKPGGRLCLTTPQTSDEHMIPYDYFRYTRYGLKSLMCDAGFLEPEIRPQGGRFILMGKMIKDLVPLMRSNPAWQKTVWILQAPVVVPLLVLCYLLDPLDRQKYFTLNYECIAKKP